MWNAATRSTRLKNSASESTKAGRPAGELRHVGLASRRSILCIYAMRYEWDEAKNLRNQRKHDGISFELAALVFADQHCLVYADRIDSRTEE